MKYDPKRVQTLMGHSTIAMTLDTYTHLWKAAEDDDSEAVRKVEKALRLVA